MFASIKGVTANAHADMLYMYIQYYMYINCQINRSTSQGLACSYNSLKNE